MVATQDGMPEGLKITSHTGQILYYSAWISGEDFSDSGEEVENKK